MTQLNNVFAGNHNVKEFSVSTLSSAIKRLIEGEFWRIRVKGEISYISRPRSGHIYLNMKDNRSVLSAVIWRGVAARLSLSIDKGMEVIATGKLTAYGGQSQYQLVIEQLRPCGVGTLMAMLEAHKKQFASEGLFDETVKQAIPYLPEVVGIVTSPSGAVISDILHRLRERFLIEVVIWPVVVQGQNCAKEVSRAIVGFNQLSAGGKIPRPSLIIVARGGGSLEDLWGFNEEAVVRAVAGSKIPLISAIGHATDVTLIDFAADLRVPTPTAAAEKAVPVRIDLLKSLKAFESRRLSAIARILNQRKQYLNNLTRGILDPLKIISSPRQRFDSVSMGFDNSIKNAFRNKRWKLNNLTHRISNPSVMISEQRQRLNIVSMRLNNGRKNILDNNFQKLNKQGNNLQPQVLRHDIKQKQQKMHNIYDRILHVVKIQRQNLRTHLDNLGRLHQTLSYKATLKRGYAVVRDDAAVLLTTKKEAQGADYLLIEFHDGILPVGALINKSKDRYNV